MKRYIIVSLLALAAGVAGAEVIEGLNYNLTTRPAAEGYAAEVTKPTPGMEYSGEITIPPTITAGGQIYTVTAIGYDAFRDQTEVTKVTAPETLEKIDSHAFNGCTSLTSFIIPGRVGSIGMYAFRKCPLTELVSLNPTPPAADANTFTGLDKATVVLYVPRGCVAAYQNAAQWSAFESILEYGDSPIRPSAIRILPEIAEHFVGETFQLSYIIEPDDATDKSVVWKSLTPEVMSVNDKGEVTLLTTGAGNIEVISNGNPALSAICRVQSINQTPVIDGIKYRLSLHPRVAEVISGDQPYSGDIVIPETFVDVITYTVVGIDQNAFANCTDLQSVTLPATIRYCRQNAFRNCTALERVVTPDIESWKRIEFANLRANPVTLSGVLYENDREVTSLSFKASEGSVRPYVAAGIRSLQTVDIEEGITAIGAGAFQYASGIKRIEIPASVSAIGGNAFGNCSSLTEINLPEGLTEIPAGLLAGTAISDIIIPQSVKEIGSQAFMGCPNLIAVALPDALQEISMRAFLDSPRIRYIRCVNTTPPGFFTWDGDPTDYGEAFSTDIWPDCQLVIPVNYFATYKSKPGWKNFRQWAYWHDYDVEIEEVIPLPGSYINREGESFILSMEVLPDNATVTNKLITVSDPEILSVSIEHDDAGAEVYRVTLLKEGEADITLWSGMCKGICHVTVDNTYSGVGDISSSEESRADIYSIDGRLIKRNVDPEALRTLAPGIYICGSRKIIIR